MIDKNQRLEEEILGLKNKIKYLEEQLHEAKNFINELYSIYDGLIVHLDTNGKVVAISDSIEKITGYKKEEIIGKNWFETLVPKEKYPFVWEIFTLLFKGNIPEVFENPILTKDGKEKIIRWRNSILKQNDKIVGTISFGIDITEELNLLTNLVDSQWNYQILVKNLPGIIYRCKYDENLTFQFISEKCEQIFGYKQDDLINNKNISFSSLIYDEDKERVLKEIQKSIEVKSVFQLRFRIKNKQGDLRWVGVQGFISKNEKDEVIGIEGFLFDITDQVKSEEELDIQKKYFKQLFENAPIGIVILDKNDKILRVNKAFEELFYFTEDEVKGFSINQLIVPPELREEGFKLSSEVLQDRIVMTEGKRMRKDGSYVDVSIIGYPILHKGQRIGIFAIYTDITQKKLMYEILRQEKERIEELNNLKSNFLLNISHEIRTPLNSILGFSELLLSELESKELKDLIEYVKSINRGGLRLLNLMDNIIEISLIESSRNELKFENLKVSVLIEPVANSFRELVAEKKLNFVIKIIDDFNIITDPSRLHLILRNLIDNAVKFTHQGEIRVSTYIEKDEKTKLGVIEISDTGIGISEKFKSKLFQPWSQESAGLNREYEGLGLGLTLSKKLTELLGGTIEIESKIDEGTKVRVKFPLSN